MEHLRYQQGHRIFYELLIVHLEKKLNLYWVIKFWEMSFEIFNNMEIWIVLEYVQV